MTKDEALKLALVTLERTGNIAGFAHEREQAAITAIRETLAQPECARCKDLEEHAYDLLGQLKVANLKWSVAHPWVGLENKELFEILEKANTRYQAVEMTEAKLKEKNT